ncbi:MAG TPA: hypothetical protein PLE32_25165 [Haliscomenobacter sp.]|nr:hypothetical protein [Haliscomenobacter sp.]
MKHFFWSKCFFCALLIVAPFALSAQITKVVGGDYITLMGIPENQIAAQANLYIGQGYMPVFVDAMYFEGKPPAGSSRAASTGIIATMILKKKPNSRMQVQLAQYNSSNNFVAQYAATKAQGWFIINQDAYLGTDNKEHYLAIWVKGNTADWGIVVDAGPVLHQSNFDQLSGLGYKMINRAYHRQPAIRGAFRPGGRAGILPGLHFHQSPPQHGACRLLPHARLEDLDRPGADRKPPRELPARLLYAVGNCRCQSLPR